MANFKVRKTGDDLKNIEIYNSYKDGKNSPFFPEYAPKSVGGTMSGVPNKDAKGNCTWYAFGRYQEVHGVRPEYPKMRKNAKLWGTDGEKLSEGPEVGGIVVFGDAGYGHVSFIEKIENGNVYLSESAYSERGNDFLFKYGRTIDQVKREWGMTVERYIAPAKPSTSYEDTPSKEHKEDGEITVTVKEGLRVRKAPSLSAEQIGLLSKGTKKVYTHYVDAEGIRWVKLKEGGYAARRTLDNKTIYADARFLKQAAKPAPAKPAPKPTKVGKYANFKDKVRLFQKSRGDACWHAQYNGQNNVYTDVRATSAKILDEDNGRVLVSVPRFNPNKVWIANSEMKLSDSPWYSK